VAGRQEEIYLIEKEATRQEDNEKCIKWDIIVPLAFRGFLLHGHNNSNMACGLPLTDVSFSIKTRQSQYVSVTKKYIITIIIRVLHQETAVVPVAYVMMAVFSLARIVGRSKFYSITFY
jgi:hypothetical protein